jgi:DNA polymerase-1
VTDPGEFDTIARQIATVGVVALDIETYGLEKADALDPRRGRIRLLQLAIPGRAPWVIDMRATGTDLGMLKHVLEPSVLIIHNARFDLGFLHEACGFQARRVFCTWTASKLLTNGTRDPNDLFAVLDRHLGISAYEDHSASDWGAVELDESQLRYAASDVVHLHALKEVLERELHTNDLMQVAELEMSLIPVVVDIEAAGLPLDMEELEKSRTQAADEADEARTALRVIAANPGLNPNSPKQVMDALTALGLNLPDTSAETLAPVADNLFVAALLKFRKRSKLAGMLRDLAAQRGANGRVHANFKPLGTETGRFSASNPNLQNIPRGSIRHMVRPPQGMVFVKADYSQIDLRAAAALAGEQEMLKAFREGQDLHRLTASRVTGKPLDQITREERQEAKAVNFGFIYAQGAEGFRKKARADYGLDLTSERASDLRQSFFNSYPAFAEWHDQTRYDADLGLDEIRTRTGRRRLLPPELGAWDRFARAVNSPVQGVAADGMKMALVELHRRLPEGARIILTVHDDVLVECPTAIGEDVKRLVEEVMRAEMGRLLPEVPIEADAEVLDRWK